VKKRGIGYACGFYGTGYGNGYPDESRADVELISDGTFIVYAAAADVGQGSSNVMRQIAAEVLETEVYNIKVVSSNTIELEDSGTTAATRQTYNTGNAVLNACKKLKANMELIKNGKIPKENRMDLVYNGMIDSGISTRTRGYFKAETTTLDPTGQGEPYWPYAFGMQRAVVEVDDETGKVDVIEITACQDVGKAVNPMMLEGQLEGAAAMGIGYSIMEKIEFIEGNIRNKNFSDYIIPSSLDVPSINSIIVEEEEISGPFGAKGVGEPALIPTAPAVINAIYAAVGVRILSLPATQEKIVEALKQKKATI
jgi:nicotinate dehydrogenase medium molybdopterin subunit